jgi:cell shape-determining protein MreD
MTPIEVLGYLTDSTFTSVVGLTVAVFAALHFIHNLGGSR